MAWCAAHPGDFERACLASTSAADLASPLRRFHPRAAVNAVRALLEPDPVARERLVLATVTRLVSDDPGIAARWARFQEDRPVARAAVIRQLRAAAAFRAPASLPIPALVLAGAGDALVDPTCARAPRRAPRRAARPPPRGRARARARRARVARRPDRRLGPRPRPPRRGSGGPRGAPRVARRRAACRSSARRRPRPTQRRGARPRGLARGAPRLRPGEARRARRPPLARLRRRRRRGLRARGARGRARPQERLPGHVTARRAHALRLLGERAPALLPDPRALRDELHPAPAAPALLLLPPAPRRARAARRPSSTSARCTAISTPRCAPASRRRA